MGMTQVTSIAARSDPLPVEYLTPVARPPHRTLGMVLSLVVAIVLVVAGGFFLFGIIQLVDHSGHEGGEIVLAGLCGMLSGIAFCGASVIFYLLTRTFLKMTAR